MPTDITSISPDFKTPEFKYPIETHCLKPTSPSRLFAPPAPDSPPWQFFPLAPENGYTLEKDTRYTRGYVYGADYDLSKLSIHKLRLLAIATPPNVYPELIGGKYVATPILGMVQMVPGIPFVVHLNGERDRTHTIGCVQTLGSLKIYPDYHEILEASVRLAKLTWGCRKSRNQDIAIPPIYELEGMKLNDRSSARDSLHRHSNDGSFSLANTILKGDGPGTILPAVQANLSPASSQIITVLETLHQLCRLILPKCISKFEFNITEFHADFMNIFAFGGLSPNGFGLQMNVSSLGELLAKAIGLIQGHWHTDVNDCVTRFTFFTLLLRLGPTADPGAFCLARGGIYCRELGAWIVWIVFKGVDLHSGFEPLEDKDAHLEWIQKDLGAAWNLAGPQNRVGYVNYTGRLPAERSGSLNATPPTGFGNYGSSAAHKGQQLNFASHGKATLGSPAAYANRMAKEAVSDFYNSLCLSDLKLNLDLNDLMEAITFNDPVSHKTTKMECLTNNPATDVDHIRRYQSLYAWHLTECNAYHMRITKEDLKRYRATILNAKQSTTSSFPTDQTPSTPKVLNQSASEDLSDIVRVFSCDLKQNKVKQRFYTLQTRNGSTYQVPEDHEGIKGNSVILNWLASTAPPSIRTDYIAAERSLVENPLTPTRTSYASPTGNPTKSIQAPGSEGRSSQHSVPKDIANLQRQSERLAKRKRRQPVEESSQYSQLEQREVNEDPVYEAEGILAHRFNDSEKNYEFLIHWKGYSADDCSWVLVTELQHAIELLSEYADRKALNLSSLRGSTNEPQSLVLADQFGRLQSLLNEKSLAQEVDDLQREYRIHMNKPKDWTTAVTLTSLAKDVSKVFGESNHLAALITFIPDNLDGRVTADILRFEIMQHMTKDLPKLELVSWQMSVINRAVYQQICRTWIIIYDWYSSTGHRLASSLVKIHRDQGMPALHKKHPAIAKLIDHIIRYVLQETTSQITKKIGSAKSKAISRLHLAYDACQSMQSRLQLQPLPSTDLTNEEHACTAGSQSHELSTPVQHPSPPSEDFLGLSEPANMRPPPITSVGPSACHSLTAETVIHDLSKVPADLYGLLLTDQLSSKLRVLTLPRLDALGQFNDISEHMYSKATCLLTDIWSSTIILPRLRHLDGIFKHRTKVSDQDIIDRAITRGAILGCIENMCSGSGVFTSKAVETFIRSPAMMFSSISKDSRFASAVKKDPQRILTPLVQSLEAILKEQPGIVEQSAALERTVHRSLAGLGIGAPLLEEEEPNDSSNNLYEEGRPTKRPKLNTNVERISRILRVDVDSLLGGSEDKQLHLGPLAVILREALNRKRSLPVADEKLSRVLTGTSITQSTAAQPKSPDYTDPIRKYSNYARIVEEYLPAKFLATRTGLSSLLSFMGTGQGSGTHKFLKRIARPSKFYCRSIDEMVEIFHSVTHDLSNPSDVRCFDMSIWGQPNPLISLLPSGHKKGSGVPVNGPKSQATHSSSPANLKEKFAPYWTEKVQKAWVVMLGKLLDRDPNTWTGALPTWSNMMEFIKGLQILLFKSGLTLLQTVNNLAFANICKMPTSEEMAAWMVDNCTLGACTGLQLLGFSTKPKPLIPIAVNCIWEHLNTFLSDSDKNDLGFSSIFLEHLLCKVTRWSNLYQNAGLKGGFKDMVKCVEDSNLTWEPNENLKNHKAFPFPLIMKQEKVEEVIKRMVLL